jgi:hypothetical protein
MQQTAISELVKLVLDSNPDVSIGCLQVILRAQSHVHFQREKQQIMDAYNQGYRDGENDGSIGCVYNTDVAKHSDAADYWQRTYGTNEPKQ